MAGGAPRPVQTGTWLRVVMEHVEDVACESRGPAGVQVSRPGPSGCRPTINLVAAVGGQTHPTSPQTQPTLVL